MSAERKPIERKPPNTEGGSDGRLKRLMKEMGGSGQFTGIPPGQLEWMEPEAPHNPPLNRMWSLMIHRTCGFGYESAYAIDSYSDRSEMCLENLAKLLDMDPSNANKTWRLGVRLGLWRNGTPQEGKRRLYLCGKVNPQEIPSENSQIVVCTNHNLPPYIEKIVNSWAPDRAKKFHADWRVQMTITNAMHAKFIAASRWATDQHNDTFLKGYGLDKKRLNREEFSVDEDVAKVAKEFLGTIAPRIASAVRLEERTAAAWDVLAESDRAARIKAAAELLQAEWRHGTLRARGWSAKRWQAEAERIARQDLHRQLAESSVQTTNDSVQSAENTSYGVVSAPRTAALPYIQPLPEEASGRAHVNLDTSSAPEQRKRSIKVEKLSTYTGGDSVERTREMLGAAAALLIGINRLQRQHPDKFAGELVSTQSRADQALGAKIVATIGPDSVDLFVLYVEQRAKDRAMGHQLTPALIFELTGDFTRRRGQIEQELRDAAAAELEAESRRQARVAEQQAEDERNLQLDEWVRDAWERLDLDDKAGRLSAAEQTMRRDPLWDRKWRNDRDARQVEREARAKRELRRELDERDRAKGVR